MKTIKTGLTNFLLVAFLMLPWATTEALETFKKAGIISKVDSSTVNVYQQDINYRIRSDTEIKIPNIAKPSMRHFKAGDEVYLRGKVLNGVYYVDLIVYLPKIPG